MYVRRTFRPVKRPEPPLFRRRDNGPGCESFRGSASAALPGTVLGEGLLQEGGHIVHFLEPLFAGDPVSLPLVPLQQVGIGFGRVEADASKGAPAARPEETLPVDGWPGGSRPRSRPRPSACRHAPPSSRDEGRPGFHGRPRSGSPSPRSGHRPDGRDGGSPADPSPRPARSVGPSFAYAPLPLYGMPGELPHEESAPSPLPRRGASRGGRASRAGSPRRCSPPPSGRTARARPSGSRRTSRPPRPRARSGC